MEKNLQNQDSGIFLEKSIAGCMRGILQHLNYHKRFHMKKRIPHNRHVSRKHSNAMDDSENKGTTSSTGEMQEIVEAIPGNSTVEAKSTEHGPVQRSSMTSRLKALIPKEVSKRRGRHRRSSSCPITQAEPSTFQLVEPSGQYLCHEMSLNDKVRGGRESDDHIVSLSDLPKLGDNKHITSSCQLCSTLNQTEGNKNGKHTAEACTCLQNTVICESPKLFFDALDLLNMRKELFLKILQDPSSSVANQLCSRRAPKLKFGLTKSVSFPMSGSSGRTIEVNNSVTEQVRFHANKEYNKEAQKLSPFASGEEYSNSLDTSKGKLLEGAAPLRLSKRPDHDDQASPRSPHTPKRQSQNKIGIKHFKNLAQKIKHAIRDSKKEKHRIVKDAVFDKIPYGSRVAKGINEISNTDEEITGDRLGKHSPRSSWGSDQSLSDFYKSRPDHFKRTASFNESIDRYSRILETTFTRDEKDHRSERLRLKATDTPLPVQRRRAVLTRILSLPDLTSYSYYQGEDSPAASCSSAAVRTDAGNTSLINSLGEQRTVGIGSENKTRLNSISESGSQESFLDVGETFEDFDSGTGEGTFHKIIENDSNYHEHKIGTREEHSISISEALAKRQLSPIDEDSPDTKLDCSRVPDVKFGTNNIQCQVQHFDSKLLHAQVDVKHKAEFNYVKDVLQMSGFSGNEALGKWYSEEHPLDPSMFEEVECSWVAEPDGLVHEEVAGYDHLFLFDLINEVLWNIYERSFSYWPMLLTNRSHIHQMPIGYHVLKEVWTDITWYLSYEPEFEQTLDDAVNRDLSKDDGWLNLQIDAECAGLEVEDLIFNELLEELILT